MQNIIEELSIERRTLDLSINCIIATETMLREQKLFEAQFTRNEDRHTQKSLFSSSSDLFMNRIDSRCSAHVPNNEVIEHIDNWREDSIKAVCRYDAEPSKNISIKMV